MPRLVLVKCDDGALAGMSDADERSYERFARHCDEMAEGETVAFTWAPPRSPEFHRAHFALLKLIFESQDTYTDPEALRAWLTVGAGHADIVPAPDGLLVAIPRSISYESLDDEAFRAFHACVLDFLRTPAAYRHLWPRLPAARAAQALDTLLLDYERGGTNIAPPPGNPREGEPMT